jgi:hypothetical protein
MIWALLAGVCRTYGGTRAIVQTMFSIDSEDAWAGFNSIFRWIAMFKEGAVPAVPRRLIETAVLIVEARRESGLLHALNISSHLLDAGMLTKEDIDRIIAALGLVYVEMSYENQDCAEITSTTFTFVRTEAVRLSDKLRKCGIEDENIVKWLMTADHDPIPEVRFALTLPEE